MLSSKKRPHENGSHQLRKYSRPRHLVENAETEPPFSLNSVISSDDVLMRIFSKLCRYGLQECRLVCKRWYRLCNEMPLSLSIRDTNLLPKASEMFPKATSLSWYCNLDDLDLRKNRSGGELPPWCIKMLPKLERLDVTIHSPRRRWLHLSTAGSFLPALSEVAQSLTALTITEINFGIRSPMWDCLNNLSKLTELNISSHSPAVSRFPLGNLSSIQKLTIAKWTIESHDGEAFFPSFTNLRELDMSNSIYNGLHFVKALLPNASTLRSLALPSFSGGLDLADDFRSLSSFSRLRSISIKSKSPAVRNCFFDVLPKINWIQELQMILDGNTTRTKRNALLSLTDLRSLSLTSRSRCHEKLVTELSRLPRLERLVLNEGVVHDGKRPFNPHLTELDFSTKRDLEFGWTSQIRKLSVKKSGIMFGHELQFLVFLRELKIVCNAVDLSFYAELGNLLHLSVLWLELTIFKFQDMHRLNNASQLRELTLVCVVGNQSVLCNPEFEGVYLSKLKYLNLRGFQLSVEARQNLNRAFPSLRKVRVT